VIAVSATALALIVLAGVARCWTWIRGRSIESAGVWGVTGEAALAAGIVGVVVSSGIGFVWFWRGAADAVLGEVRAVRVDADGVIAHRPGKPTPSRAEVDARRRTANLVEELSIGLGRPVPELWVTDDPTPNALSMRSSTRRAICVTSGVASLTRDELEAMLAHEMGHLWALDAQWVGSGMVALARGRRAGLVLMTAGAVMLFLLVTGATTGGRILWSTGLFAIALMVLGAGCTPILRRLELSMRRHADEIADVAAVRLARNPGSLAALCARLAEDDEPVRTAGWRSELMWFEMVEAADLAGEVDPTAPARTRLELVERALAAYATAGEAVPEASRDRFTRWLDGHP